jgi:DNA-binding XRE family transcriptional regulator
MTPEQFQQARQTLGLTQSALGDLLGLHKRQIIRIEGGDLRPIHALAMLALLDGHRVAG